MRIALLAIIVTAAAATGTAAADPDPVPASPPEKPVPSLRLEAARVAAERFEDNWRFPAPGAVAGLDGGAWFVGAGHYRPRSSRSAALGAGSVAASLVGEILMGVGSPLAGVGAMLAGATMDAAAADVDRDVEAHRPTDSSARQPR